MRNLRILTAGESHGKAIHGIIDGVPAGLKLKLDDFAIDAARRREGLGRSERMKKEDDVPEVLSGIRLGKTTGAPVCIRIENKVHEQWLTIMKAWDTGFKASPMTVPRPGHADLAGALKYGLDDIRDVIERASARETVMRSAFGTIAKKFISEFGCKIISRPLTIDGIKFKYDDLLPVYENIDGKWHKIEREVKSKYADKETGLIRLKNKLLKNGNTCGGTFQILAHKIPIGLGSYSQPDMRLDAVLASAIMSIPSVKGFVMGAGLKSDSLFGIEYMDAVKVESKNRIRKIQRKSNNAGGIEGGITNGEPLIFSAFVKPIPTTRIPQESVDLKTMKARKSHYENADLWVVEAVGVIAESMTALVLMDAMLSKYGGDSMTEIHRHFKS